jgi:hypothetical protein
VNCHYCDQPAKHGCDICDRRFCEDHGTPSTIAYGIETSACANCGGYSCDDAEEAVA